MSDKRFGMHRISVQSMVTELQEKKVFCKQTADHEYTSYLLLKIPTWNRIPYTQTNLFYVITMSGK